MRISLPLAVFACSPGPETPVPEAVEPPTMVPDAEAPTSLLPESNVRLRAEFHIDETTGLPGSWTDEDGETRPAELEIIVGDDTYNGVDGTFCRVLVPLDPRRTTLRGGLETGQLWGVDFTAERSAITTDCDEPAFEPISRFYDDDVVGFMTTNQDGSPVTWSIVLEAPSSTDIAWLEGPWLDGDAVIGGQMWLSDRVSAGWSSSFAGFVFETDEDATVTLDEEGEPTFVPFDEVAAGPDVRQGAYRLLGYRLTRLSADR